MYCLGTIAVIRQRADGGLGETIVGLNTGACDFAGELKEKAIKERVEFFSKCDFRRCNRCGVDTDFMGDGKTWPAAKMRMAEVLPGDREVYLKDLCSL